MSFITDIVKSKLDTLASIADLAGLTGVEGQQVSVASYHGLDDLSGGGTFVWGTGRHNGGTFIDPNRPFPTDWNDQAQLEAWFADSGEDEFCFVRTGSILNINHFGAIANNAGVDNSTVFNNIVQNLGEGFELEVSGKYYIGTSLEINKSQLGLTLREGAEFVLSSGFIGSEVFRLGFKSGNSYTIDGSINNLRVDFSECDSIVDVFNCKYIARYTFDDMQFKDLRGTVFNESSIGHEITCRNLYAESAEIVNGTGVHINFTDSYFEDIKAIGFSEFGIVNDGADNRFYGCHPWSYPRNSTEKLNFTTKILFWDKEDGMWTDCYADTFQREDENLPPSFSNGGIAYYFSKVSGIGRMLNCGFYALDTATDSLIGVATDSGPQQINIVNGYILGSNPDAYLKFVSTPSPAVAKNLFGCNFSEDSYQAKENMNENALLSNTEFYIKNRDSASTATLQTKLQTFADRRLTHGLLATEDNGVDVLLKFWDHRANLLHDIPHGIEHDWVEPSLLNSWANSGGSLANVAYKKDATGTVFIKGYVKDGVTTLGTSIFNLPAGFRPDSTLGFAQICGASYNQQASIGVNSSGSVYILSCPSNVNLSVTLSYKV